MAKDAKVAVKKQYNKTQPVRLYQKAVFTSFRRSRTHQWENQALVEIQNCKSKADAKWYMGKRVAYVFKVKNIANNTRYRVQWGTIMNTHGAAGMVRVKFLKNITGCAIGANVRVMLYPNKTV
jgi:large subunit ribosomal protein L35Ae